MDRILAKLWYATLAEMMQPGMVYSILMPGDSHRLNELYAPENNCNRILLVIFPNLS